MISCRDVILNNRIWIVFKSDGYLNLKVRRHGVHEREGGWLYIYTWLPFVYFKFQIIFRLLAFTIGLSNLYYEGRGWVALIMILFRVSFRKVEFGL